MLYNTARHILTTHKCSTYLDDEYPDKLVETSFAKWLNSFSAIYDMKLSLSCETKWENIKTARKSSQETVQKHYDNWHKPLDDYVMRGTY